MKNRFFDYEPVRRSGARRPIAGDEFPERIAKNVEAAPVESAPQPKSPASEENETTFVPVLTRGGGHGLTFIGFVMFTFMLYFRPYEYVPGLMGVPLLTFWIAILTLCIYIPSQIAITGTLTERPPEVNYLLLLIIAAALSIPLAIAPGEAWETFYNIFLKFALMCIVMINVVRTERRLRIMFLLSLAAAFVLSLGALNEYRTGNLTVEGYRAKGVIGSVFGDPNDMALYLVTMAPIAFALGFGKRGILKKLIFVGLLTLFVAGIAVTYSRGGFLGLITITLVLGWKLGKRRRFVVFGSLLTAITTFMIFAPGNYWFRMLTIFIPSLDPNGSAIARKNLLIGAIKNALYNPVFGLGMGNFYLVASRGNVNHNAYLEVATELGLFALVMYLAFMISALRRLRKIEKATFGVSSEARFYYLAVALQASILGYMVTSFFLSVAYYWNIYYLVAFAVCLGLVYQSRGGIVNAPSAAKDGERKIPRSDHLGYLPTVHPSDPSVEA
jgi:O-antigen ligase